MPRGSLSGQLAPEVVADSASKPQHTFECLPQQAQTMYQLCDLSGEDMQGLVRGASMPQLCDSKLGWYPKGVHMQLRRLMKQRLLRFLDQAGIVVPHLQSYVSASGKLDTEWMSGTGGGGGGGAAAAAVAASTGAAQPEGSQLSAAGAGGGQQPAGKQPRRARRRRAGEEGAPRLALWLTAAALVPIYVAAKSCA
eukprot:COSAG01_NODE_1378_length_10526_cov_13.789105_6_plen_195_part_00